MGVLFSSPLLAFLLLPWRQRSNRIRRTDLHYTLTGVHTKHKNTTLECFWIIAMTTAAWKKTEQKTEILARDSSYDCTSPHNTPRLSWHRLVNFNNFKCLFFFVIGKGDTSTVDAKKKKQKKRDEMQSASVCILIDNVPCSTRASKESENGRNGNGFYACVGPHNIPCFTRTSKKRWSDWAEQ